MTNHAKRSSSPAAQTASRPASQRKQPKRRRTPGRSHSQQSLAAADLAKDHIEKIRFVASSIRRSYSLPKSDVNDLFQQGFTAALAAARLYLDGRNNKATYWTYASKRIRLAVSDFAQTRQGEVSRRHMRRIHADGRELRFEGFDLSQISSGSQPAEDVLDLIRRLCQGMHPRYAAILADRFAFGLSVQQIAAKQKLTIRSVSQTIYVAINRIRTQFSFNPIDGITQTGVISQQRDHRAISATSPQSETSTTTK